jgi:probable F420-dependent oxidoreductase
VDAFRFGVNMMAPAGRSEWLDKCREAEDLGYDVLCVADHLGMPAPFPALLLAAEATERPKLCPFVLNAGFYSPALLAREVTTMQGFVGGRLELGIGTGYVKAEFEQAGVPWQNRGARVEHLERTLDQLDETGLPLLIGGWGHRMLRLAARRAQIISFTGANVNQDDELASLASLGEFRERVGFVRGEPGGREAELNVLVQRVVLTTDRTGTLEQLQPYAPELSVEELGELPTLLIGTPEQIAAQLRENQDKLGLGYVTVLERDLHDFAQVIELLA